MDRTQIQDMIEPGLRLIPVHMHGGVQRYFLDGILPGHFLTAVLTNDLMEAFARADDENAAAMQGWCRFLYNHVPSGSYGSPDKVRAWLASFEAEAA